MKTTTRGQCHYCGRWYALRRNTGNIAHHYATEDEVDNMAVSDSVRAMNTDPRGVSCPGSHQAPMPGTTKTGPALSPAMLAAMAQLKRDGQVGAYNGVSTATIAALETRGLVVVTWRPPVHRYGTLGPAGGRNKGYLCRNWTAVLA